MIVAAEGKTSVQCLFVDDDMASRVKMRFKITEIFWSNGTTVIM